MSKPKKWWEGRLLPDAEEFLRAFSDGMDLPAETVLTQSLSLLALIVASRADEGTVPAMFDPSTGSVFLMEGNYPAVDKEEARKIGIILRARESENLPDASDNTDPNKYN